MVQREKEESVRHRGRFDIIATILNTTTNGAKKTQIMYKCNLSFKQIELYLSMLTAKQLLNGRRYSESREVVMYTTTEKGRSFLQVYRTLNTLLTT